VKGKDGLVTVYEVFDACPEPLKAAKLFTLEQFTKAIQPITGTSSSRPGYYLIIVWK
jgi:hypothetical protein